MKSAQKESLAVELHNGEVLHLGVANLDLPVSFVVEWTHRRQPAMHHVLDTNDELINCLPERNSKGRSRTTNLRVTTQRSARQMQCHEARQEKKGASNTHGRPGVSGMRAHVARLDSQR